MHCSIDATNGQGLARFCNDETVKPNAVMKKVITNRVYLCIFALRDINTNDEIVYHYGPDDEQNMLWRYRRNQSKSVIAQIDAPVEELFASLKFEDVSSEFRPYLQIYDDFASIDLTGDLTQGIFRMQKQGKKSVAINMDTVNPVIQNMLI
jgi:hypothetical protein